MTAYRTIYVVTKGQYDQCINICAWREESDAQKAVAQGVGDDYFELPLMAHEVIPHTTTVYEVTRHPLTGEPSCAEEQRWPWEMPSCAIEVTTTMWGWTVASVDRATAMAEAERLIAEATR